MSRLFGGAHGNAHGDAHGPTTTKMKTTTTTKTMASSSSHVSASSDADSEQQQQVVNDEVFASTAAEAASDTASLLELETHTTHHALAQAMNKVREIRHWRKNKLKMTLFD